MQINKLYADLITYHTC